VADLQVSIALLLENQDEIRRALEAEGGKAGEAFRNRLTPAAKKAFDEITSAAEKAAKDVGVRFNSTKLQFETAKGEIIPSSVLDKISQGGSKIAAAFKEARNGVDVFKSAVVKGAGEAASSLNILESAVTGVAVSLTSKLTDSVTAGLGGLKGLVGGFMELDGELRMAAAAAGETGGYERLGSIVEKVGIDAAGTSKQVAELATSLVRAGFSVSEVEKALPGVVRGAEATGTGFEQMGDIIGSTLRGFGLEADQVGRVTDVMVNLANSTNASIEGMAYTFRDTAPIAKALGISLEEVAMATGLMANAGIQGTVAGTALKHFMQKIQQAAGGATPEVLGLAHGQERLAKVMKMLGAEVLDTSGKLLPMDEVLIRLKAGMDKLNEGDRVQLTKILFGEDAGPSVLAMLNQTATEIKKVSADMQNSAGATDVARNAMAGFGMEMQQLQGTIDAIGTGIGKVIAAGLRPFLQTANALAGAVSGMPEPIKTTGAALIAMAGAATAASLGIAALNVVMGTTGWAALRKEITSVAAVLTGPWGAAAVMIAGAAASAAVLTGNLRETDQTTKTMAQTVITAGAAFAAWRSAVPVTIALGQALLIVTNRAKLAGALTLAHVAAARGIAAVTAAYTALKVVKDAIINRTKIQLTLESLIAGLKTGGIAGAVVTVAGTALAAGAAYKFIGDQIKVAGEETTALSDKSKELKEEIAQVSKEIAEGKKLNIDTTDLEKLKAVKLDELRKIENPLDIKLNIEKVEAQIKSIEEQLKKVGKDDSSAGVLKAQLDAAKQYQEVLKAADDGIGSKSFDNLSESGKRFVRELVEARSQVQALRNEQIKLDPVVDKKRWDEIETKIAQFEEAPILLKAKIEFEKAGLEKQRAELEADLARAQKGVSKGRGEPNDNFAKRKAENDQLQGDLSRQLLGVKVKIAEVDKASADAAGKQVDAARNQVQTAEEKYDAAKKAADAENIGVGNQQKQIDNANKLMGLDKARLETIRQMADAYLNMAQAMAGLQQARFDVSKARVGRQISDAQDELSAMRDSSNAEIDALQSNSDKELEAVQEQARIRDKMWEKDMQRAKDSGAGDSQISAMERRRADERERTEEQIRTMRKRSEEEINAKRKEAAEAAKAKEEEIKALKEREKAIEKEALAASMESAAKRFEMERKALELKQLATKMEQEAAVRTAQRAVLDDQRQLIDLKAKQQDPNLTPQQKAAYGEAIALQQESLALSGAQVVAEKERLGQLGQQFAMEREMLAIKQNTEVEGFRAQAAKGGWEGDLSPQLKQLDDQKGKVGQVEMAWKDVTAQADQLLGVINQHNNAIDSGIKKLGDLGNAYKDAAGKAAGIGAPGSGGGGVPSGETGGQKALPDSGAPSDNPSPAGPGSAAAAAIPPGGKLLPLTLDGKQLVADANGVFLTIEREYRDMQGRLLGITTNTWRAISEEEARAIESASEAQQREFNKLAEQDVNLKSTEAATYDLGVFDDAAKQAGVSVEDLGRHLKDVGFVELNAGALDVDQQSIESLQKARDELFGPEAQKRLFTPEGMKDLPDFSLKPTVDTAEAAKDIAAFKESEISQLEDPVTIRVKTDALLGNPNLSEFRKDAEAYFQGLNNGDNLSNVDSVDLGINFSGMTPEEAKSRVDSLGRALETTDKGDISVMIKADALLDESSLAGFKETAKEKLSGAINDNVYAVEFTSTGLDQVQADFTNAANSIVPFSNQVDQLGMDLQALNGGGVDPFQGAGQSLSEAAYGAQALVQGLETANQSAAEFDTTLADSANADQIQQAYDALQPPDLSQAVSEQGNLAQGTEGTIQTTQGLASSWVDVTASINAAATALANYKSQESGGKARFAGGDVRGGTAYTVNELGQESFLSSSGMLSLIRAPQYGKWVAPSRGLVIPASMTSKLDAAGAFDRGGRGPSRVTAAFAGPSPGQGNQVAALGRLQRSIDRLEKTMGSYRAPDVHVSVPGNAGLLRTLQSIR
jgi:TP901 family phage tail tape measure protein